MKKLLLLLVFCPVFVFGQIGSLPYQLLRQSYRGDTVYTKLNGDSVNYYTDLGSFRFNKDIYVKGVKLGSGGGGSEIAKYLKNYSPTDTVISITNAPAYTTAISVKTSLANQCIRLQNNMSYGYGLLSYVTGNEGVAGYFEASGSPANTAYGLKVNTKYAYGLMIDSLNTHKYSINSSGIPRIYNFAGTGNRSLIAQPDGTIAVGSASGVIATQLKNYNINQDTVIRLPDLASGKFGIWQNVNNGIGRYTSTNNSTSYCNFVNNNIGYETRITTNNGYGYSVSINNGRVVDVTSNSADKRAFHVNTNSGDAFVVGTNGGTLASGFLVMTNNGIGFNLSINNPSGYGYYLDTNNGNGFFIKKNYGYGFRIATNNAGYGLSIYNITNNGIGVTSYAADTVSNTSGALTGTFGKTASHLDIDGFGHTKLIQSSLPTVTLSTGAGTGATYSLTTGSNDRAGQITITTGTTPATDALIFTITYANPYKGNTFTCYTPANANASSVVGANRPHVNGVSNTGTSLYSGSTSLSANTTYVWNYIVQQ